MFLQVRDRRRSQDRRHASTTLIPSCPTRRLHQLATYAIAGADGLFIAHEIGGDTVDLLALFELHAAALYDSALRMVAEKGTK